MKKWLPTFISIALGGIAVASPDIQATIAKHPELAGGLGAVYAVLKGLLPSPIEPK